MTEAEWLNSTDPKPMLNFLQGKTSERKFRLFAVACCRRMENLPVDMRSRMAVEVAERFADGLAQEDERIAAEEEANAADRITYLAAPAARVIRLDAAKAAVDTSDLSAAFAVDADEPSPVELVSQTCLIHDIFGDPFRPITINPTWLTSTVLALVQGIYNERAFDRMPILADALQDAGCDNEEILNHCRQPGEHVRGCWVVDLLLSKQ
jgi:hypothetical protein